MKLPIPFLLYVLALGLFGVAAWTVYEMLPMWKPKVREDATRRGQDAATSLLTKGRSQGPRSTAWVYGGDTFGWWASFKAANLIGKPPPKPVEQTAAPEVNIPPPVEVKPLEQLIELIGLVYDGKGQGKGGNTHVIVRFKPEANVEPPEWWVRENSPPSPGSNLAAMPGRRVDTVPQPPPRGARGGNPRPPAPPPMPASSAAGMEIVQRLWVEDGGDPRRSATLWPVKAADGRPMGTIRLVRVSADAQVAYFAREVPGAKPEDPPQTREEELIKNTANLSQELLRQLRELRGGSSEGLPRTGPAASTAPLLNNRWVDVEETTRSGNTVNIGREDDRMFRQDPDAFLEQLNFDTYVSSDRSTRGIIVKGVPAKIASRFGVQVGDVLIEVNGKAVKSRTDAYSTAKGDYQRGVRTFTTKWMSNGQIVERIYQVPDKD